MGRVDQGPPTSIPPAGPVLALPNILTLSRVPLGLLMWVAADSPPFAFAVIGAAALSDMLDGWFVRRMQAFRQQRGDPGAYAAGTGLGAFLDPLCDKFFVVSTLGALWWALEPPLYLLLLVAAREILMAPLFAMWRWMPGPYRRRKIEYTAQWPGKLATGLQFACIPLTILNHTWLVPVAWATAISGSFAVLFYLRRMVASRRPPLDRDPPSS